MAERFHRWPEKVTARWDRLELPLKVKKPTVWAVWNDLFHEDVPDEFIEQFINVVYEVWDSHIFLVLTKRAKRMAEFFLSSDRPALRNDLCPSLWLGVTVCNQQEADKKIPILLKIPAAYRWVSIEPCLSSIDLCNIGIQDLDCVILGGETIGKRMGREMKIEWAESIVSQCEDAGVPVFVKQIHLNGRLSKDINEWPIKLRRRELPYG